MKTFVVILAALFVALGSVQAFATTYNSPPSAVPATLGSGDVLNLLDGGQTPVMFKAGLGSTVNVNGGTIGLINEFRGELNVTSGAVGQAWNLIGGRMNVYGGAIWPFGSVREGSEVNVYGGGIDLLGELSDSTVNSDAGLVRATSEGPTTLNLYDGTLETFTMSESTLNIRGGVVNNIVPGNGFNAVNWSGGALVPKDNMARFGFMGALNVTVLSATVNGQPIPGLIGGATVTVTNRNVPLAGVLADGSSFGIPLRAANDILPGMPYYFGPNSLVKVTLVPEPTSAVVGLIFLTLSAKSATGCRQQQRETGRAI